MNTAIVDIAVNPLNPSVISFVGHGWTMHLYVGGYATIHGWIALGSLPEFAGLSRISLRDTGRIISIQDEIVAEVDLPMIRDVRWSGNFVVGYQSALVFELARGRTLELAPDRQYPGHSPEYHLHALLRDPSCPLTEPA